MPGPRPKAPGWYPEPDILPGSRTVLRYWNGHHWTERRRPAPVLATYNFASALRSPTLRALEGPARAVELPAPAAEVSAGRDGPGGRADTLDRPGAAEVRNVELPTTTGGGRGVPPQPPAVGGGGGGGGDQGDGAAPARATRRIGRRKWWFLVAMGVLCAAAVTLAGEALRTPSPGPRVVTDAAFVKAANALCAKTLPSLRPTYGGEFGSLVTPVQAASDIDQTAPKLDELADRLGALPDAPGDRPFVTTWLNEWHHYAALGRQFAGYLRQHGATKKPPPMLAPAAAVARQADNFALANGIKSCQFTYVDSASGSNF